MLLLCAILAGAQEADQCVGIITLAWPGHDLSHAQVRVFRDAARQDLAGAFPSTSADGKVVVAVPAGTYYLTAVVDSDNDGKISAGDGLAFSGVTDPNKDRPAAVEVKDKAFALWLPISLVMGAEGKLSPAAVARPEPPPAAKAVGLSGAVTGRGAAGLVIVYAVPKLGQGLCYAALPDATGKFALTVVAGDYYLFAVQDANATEKVDAGDLMAVSGYQAGQGRAFPTTAFTADTTDLKLDLQWRIAADGLLKAVAGEAEGPLTAPETMPAVVYGGVVGTSPATVTTLRATTDAHFPRDAGGAVTEGGRFVLALPAGTYFFSLMADADGDGKPSPGDLLGFYGVTNLRLGHGPQPLLLTGGEIRPLDFTLCGKLGADLHPVALP